MSSRVTGEKGWRATARIVTAVSCAAVLWSTLEPRQGHEPPPGTRTAIELIANGAHRGLPKVLLTGVMS